MITTLNGVKEEIAKSAKKMETIEDDMERTANDHFQRNPKQEMDEGDRAIAFSDLMIEFEKSTDLMLKKFGRLDNKIYEMGKFTDDFHKSTDQLESLYLRDIE